MGKSKFRGQRPLTPAEQAYFLTFAFPQFRVLTVRNLLRAVGTLQPTPTCDQYTIELEYCDCGAQGSASYARSCGWHRGKLNCPTSSLVTIFVFIFQVTGDRICGYLSTFFRGYRSGFFFTKHGS
jgi:hypothetical protein